MTITELQNLKAVGNHHGDSGIFKKCHDFIMNPDNTMEEKIEAIKVIHKTMGTDADDDVTSEEVEQYIFSAENDCW